MSLFLAIERRDLASLQKLARSAEALAKPNAEGEEPLPKAARAGWAEGVAALAAAGADPNRPDKDPSGIRNLGKPPLCEALSRGHAATAQALIDAGAAVAGGDRDLLWALVFYARKAGWSAALDLFEPLEAQGFNPTAQAIGSAWLFVGSSLATGGKTEEDRARASGWLDAKLGDIAADPNQGDCAWHLIFGAAGKGWCPEPIARALALSRDEARNPGSRKASRTLMALEWGLEEADEALSRVAAQALAELGSAAQAAGAFVKAASARPNDRLFGDRAFALRQARCFESAHALCLKAGAPLSPERVEAIGMAGYESGQAGMALGALRAGLDPQSIVKARQQAAYGYSRSDWTHPARELCALFAAATLINAQGEEAARAFWSQYDSDFWRQSLTQEERMSQRIAQTEQEAIELLLREQAKPAAPKTHL